MKTVAASCIALAAVALLPGVAMAGCAGFESVGTGLSIEYNPFTGAPVNRTFEIRVRRTDPSVTAVKFVLADPDPRGGETQFGSAGPRGYDVEWVRDASQPVFFRGAEQPNATNGATVTFKPGPSGDVVGETFRLRVPPGRSVGAGDYYEPLEVRYVCYSGEQRLEAPEIQPAGRVALDLRTEDMISAYVGSMGVRRGEINLGELSPNGPTVSGSVVVTAQSTSPYEIGIGAKWGVLRRREGDAAGVPYAMRLGGQAVTAGSTVVCDRTPAPSGRAHTLQVSVRGEDAATQPAGDYSDTITLTFSPRLGLAAPEGCSI